MTPLSDCMEPKPSNQSMWPSGCPECQRLKELITDLENVGSSGNVETVVFLDGQNCNKPLNKMTFKEFKEEVLYRAGCRSYKSSPVPNQSKRSVECPECQGLKKWLSDLENSGLFRKVETVMFLSDQGCRNPLDKMTFEEFRDRILYFAGCCSYKHNPISKEWMEYKRFECIWENLKKETVKKITFSGYCAMEDSDPIEEQKSPEDRDQWAVITEPEKISEVLQLLHEATDKEEDKFSNDYILADTYRDQMQIVTNKHKYIIPIEFNKNVREITYGIGWTSYKLGKKLVDWGLAEPMSEEEYRVLECVWENLKKENIQRITFYQSVRGYFRPPSKREWGLWGEITEQRKINEVLKLLGEALKEGDKTFVDEGYFESKEEEPFVRMQIVTDKHKYIIPFFLYREGAYGQGWTSYDLRKKLTEWGLAKPVLRKEYMVPECIWENIEKENIRRIDFYKYVSIADPYLLDLSKEWRLCGGITEPQKINEMLELIREARKKRDNKFFNKEFVEDTDNTFLQMRIITDKQECIMSFFLHGEAAYGAGWTSEELRKKLAEWGFIDHK